MIHRLIPKNIVLTIKFEETRKYNTESVLATCFQSISKSTSVDMHRILAETGHLYFSNAHKTTMTSQIHLYRNQSPNQPSSWTARTDINQQSFPTQIWEFAGFKNPKIEFLACTFPHSHRRSQNASHGVSSRYLLYESESSFRVEVDITASERSPTRPIQAFSLKRYSLSQLAYGLLPER